MPYLFTLTFLMLLGIVSTESLTKAVHHTKSSSENSEIQQLIQKKFLENRIEQETISLNSPSTPTDPKKKEGPPKSLNFCRQRPPNNARFNLYLLLMQEYPTQHFLFPIFESLIQNLYKEVPQITDYPNLASKLINELKEHKEKYQTFQFPDELGFLTFSDPYLRSIFYHMLKGLPFSSNQKIPSLLEYITFDTNTTREEKKFSFLFMSSELMQILSPNPHSFQQLEKIRKEFLLQIEEQEAKRLQTPHHLWKGRKDLKNELLEMINHLAGYDPKIKKLKRSLDFSLGKKGNVVFICNPQTGEIIREPLENKENQTKK